MPLVCLRLRSEGVYGRAYGRGYRLHDDFIKGLNDGANAGDDKKKAAYYAGIQIGQQISNQMVKGINHEVFGDDSTKTISLKNFTAGFITVLPARRV